MYATSLAGLPCLVCMPCVAFSTHMLVQVCSTWHDTRLVWAGFPCMVWCSEDFEAGRGWLYRGQLVLAGLPDLICSYACLVWLGAHCALSGSAALAHANFAPCWPSPVTSLSRLALLDHTAAASVVRSMGSQCQFGPVQLSYTLGGHHIGYVSQR